MNFRNADRRHSPRHSINRVAHIQVGGGAARRECLITDLSAGGVRLQVEGFAVPDDFVLFLADDDAVRECKYQVVWRFGNEVGASFIGLVRRQVNSARSPEVAPS